LVEQRIENPRVGGSIPPQATSIHAPRQPIREPGRFYNCRRFSTIREVVAMDSIKDVLESLRLHIRSRLSNPLYAAYIFSWVILNFRVLLVLFSEGEWEDKIQYIDERMYPAWWHWAWFGFGYPLLAAVGIVLTTPFIQRWVSVFIREREKKTIALLLKIAEETPLPPEEADRLRKKLIDERQARKDEQGRLTAEVSELNAQVELLKKENDRLRAAAPVGIDVDEVVPEQRKQATAKLETLPVTASDFAGPDKNAMTALVSTGLSPGEATALNAMRDGEEVDADDLAMKMGLREEYAAQVLLDRLEGFRLISPSQEKSKYFFINSFGRQALSALMQRGFKPA
jgi:hypothetical protein